MKVLIAALLACIVLLLAAIYGTAVSVHLDADRETAKNLARLKNTCGKPRFLKIGEAA